MISIFAIDPVEISFASDVREVKRVTPFEPVARRKRKTEAL